MDAIGHYNFFFNSINAQNKIRLNGIQKIGF
jgi:hypothetical protein